MNSVVATASPPAARSGLGLHLLQERRLSQPRYGSQQGREADDAAGLPSRDGSLAGGANDVPRSVRGTVWTAPGRRRKLAGSVLRAAHLFVVIGVAMTQALGQRGRSHD